MIAKIFIPPSDNLHLQVLLCGFSRLPGSNKAAVQAAFDAWRGAPEALRLLTPDASGTITQLLGRED